MKTILDKMKLNHPVVLVHGMGARSKYGPFDYFHGLPKLLRDAGNEVFTPNLTAWHTVEHRAEQLKRQIEVRFPDQKVNLIGHSLGGLDARYMTSRLECVERVASVTTIGTPNRGTLIADLALGLVPNATFKVADRFLKLLDSSSGAFQQICAKYHSNIFSTEVPDAPGVGYFSATSAIPNPIMKHSLPLFWLSTQLLSRYEGDNDGFVSVQSALWGQHICTYQGDHYAQIGQFLGRSRGLDYMQFYTDIFSRLKKEGF
ncbi:MAG: alpha/beta fold hydrolase [Methylotenera sp.]|nr:alpha/beta fold hydrolase [Oligoflexia bacterium]